jgi:hypothetical protein
MNYVAVKAQSKNTAFHGKTNNTNKKGNMATVGASPSSMTTKITSTSNAVAQKLTALKDKVLGFFTQMTPPQLAKWNVVLTIALLLALILLIYTYMTFRKTPPVYIYKDKELSS